MFRNWQKTNYWNPKWSTIQNTRRRHLAGDLSFRLSKAKGIIKNFMIKYAINSVLSLSFFLCLQLWLSNLFKSLPRNENKIHFVFLFLIPAIDSLLFNDKEKKKFLNEKHARKLFQKTIRNCSNVKEKSVKFL